MSDFKKAVDVTKTVVGIIGGIGVSAIVGNAVKTLSPTSGMGIVMKTCVTVGTALLGGVACNATDNYLEEVSKTIFKIDEAVKENIKEETTDEEVEVVSE